MQTNTINLPENWNIFASGCSIFSNIQRIKNNDEKSYTLSYYESVCNRQYGCAYLGRCKKMDGKKEICLKIDKQFGELVFSISDPLIQVNHQKLPNLRVEEVQIFQELGERVYFFEGFWKAYMVRSKIPGKIVYGETESREVKEASLINLKLKIIELKKDRWVH